MFYGMHGALGLRAAGAAALIVAVSIAGAAVGGCSTSTPSGPPLSSLQITDKPKAGMARVVVLRLEKGFIGFGDREFPINLDGEPMGDLVTGSFLEREVKPGRHEKSGILSDQAGISRYEFDAVAGRTHYVVASLKAKVNQTNAGGALGGITGLVIVGVLTDDGGGPFDFKAMDEANARWLIAKRL
jgi:hypothetical protein